MANRAHVENAAQQIVKLADFAMAGDLPNP